MATTMQMENHFPAFIFNVQAQAGIQSPGPYPTNIIHAGEPVSIDVDWTQTGLASDVSLFNAGCHYHLNVYLEKFGPGGDPNVPSPPLVLIQQGPGPINYSQSISLPALTTGVYKVIVTMNFVVPGHVANFIHGYAELGVLQVVPA